MNHRNVVSFALLLPRDQLRISISIKSNLREVIFSSFQTLGTERVNKDRVNRNSFTTWCYLFGVRFYPFYLLIFTEAAVACSKSTMEKPEQCVKYVKSQK